MKKMKNKDGSLTFYAFACGYITTRRENGMWKEMYYETPCFHVRAGREGEKWSLWETFEIREMTKAKKFYKSIKL